MDDQDKEKNAKTFKRPCGKIVTETRQNLCTKGTDLISKENQVYTLEAKQEDIKTNEKPKTKKEETAVVSNVGDK